MPRGRFLGSRGRGGIEDGHFFVLISAVVKVLDRSVDGLLDMHPLLFVSALRPPPLLHITPTRRFTHLGILDLQLWKYSLEQYGLKRRRCRLGHFSEGFACRLHNISPCQRGFGLFVCAVLMFLEFARLQILPCPILDVSRFPEKAVSWMLFWSIFIFVLPEHFGDIETRFVVRIATFMRSFQKSEYGEVTQVFVGRKLADSFVFHLRELYR